MIAPYSSSFHLARWAIWGSVFGFCSTVFLLDNVVEWHPVRGNSMSPSLSPEYDRTRSMDRVLFSKLNPTQKLTRGEVISFWAPHDPEKRVVKRVIGLPGDVVFPKQRYPVSSVQVPYGHVWVEGDNVAKTKDSNDYGPISQSLLTGRAQMVVWPPNRLGTRPWEGHVTATRVIEGIASFPQEYED